MEEDPNEPQEKRLKLGLKLPRPSIEAEITPQGSGTPLEEILCRQGSLESRLQPQQHLPGGPSLSSQPCLPLPQRNNLLPPKEVKLPVVQNVSRSTTVRHSTSSLSTKVSKQTTVSQVSPDVSLSNLDLGTTYPTLEKVVDLSEIQQSPMEYQQRQIKLDSSLKLFPVNQGTPLEWEHFLPCERAEDPDEDFYGTSYATCINSTDNETMDSEAAENESSDIEQGKDPSLLLPLFVNSPLTVQDSIVSILTYASSCHLSGVEFCKLLDLVHLLLPKPNNLPTSKHVMFNIFKNDSEAMNVIYYCNVCWKRRASLQDKCDVCKTSSVKYFIACSIVSQLQKLYARPGFVDKLSYKEKRTKENLDNIEDVYDGAIYKEAEQNFPFDDFNISLTWYTDGVSLYNCSSYSLWPFMFVINELPPEERYKEENLIIGGLWGDSDKPHPNIFLLPIYNEIVKMKDGFPVKLHGGVEKEVKAIVLCGTCDVPAKASFMNMKGHAGYYSCPKCFIHGEKSARTGNVMVFPHEDNLVLRTDANYQECVTNAVNSKTEDRGVAGPTVLSFMVHSSFIRSTNVDSMHCLAMGILKQLLRLWFNSKFSEEPFSLSKFVDKVNKLLKQLNLPHFVERLPEDVTKLHFWKASLCRNFLLYIGLVIMKKVMKPAYFSNFCLLVKGISILHNSSISQSDITMADQYLCQFSKEFQVLYGVRHMSSNIHLLRHLASAVRDCGNLCLTSCFKFEDLNGKLASLVHGTVHATKQIYRNLLVLSELPLLVSKLQCEDAKLFCRKLTHRKYLTYGEKIADHVYVIGNIDTVTQHYSEISELCSCLHGPTQVRTFSRVMKEGTLFVSASYSLGSRVSSYCKYLSCDGEVHGQILCFVKSCVNPPCYFAYMLRSDDVPVENLDRFVIYCSANAKTELIPIMNIRCLSWCLTVDNVSYLVDPLNKYEME